MAKYFIDHIQRNDDQQAKIYVSSGVGPEQEEETETGNQQIIDAAGNRVELIHPNHVLKALKSFLEEYRGHQKYV
jgi:4-hydroxy-3-methylbut-2-enyl diphosphate reductase IspH